MSRKINQTIKALGLLMFFLSLGSTKLQAHPERGGVSLQVFYDELSYYGDWINNPDYGYVWRPNVGRDFRPYYTNGHWVMTEYGNTWVSDYEWGWAPFHYGRWYYDNYDGWIWVPDVEWGPAWVTWRTGGGYYGWAPLGPRISINISFGRRYYVPDNYWVFIPQRCIYYPSYSRYWEPRRNVYIINNTTIINNIYTNKNVRYYGGPGVDEVRRATRQNVPVYRVADGDRPSSTRVTRDAVTIYRPDVRKDDRNSAPRTIANDAGRPTRSSDNNMDRSGNSYGNNGQRPGVSDDNNRPYSSPSDRGIDSRSQRPDRSGNEVNGRPDRMDQPQRPQMRTQPQDDNQPSARPYDGRNNRPDVSDRPSEKMDRSDAPSRVERPSNPGNYGQDRSSAPQRQEPRNESSRPQRVERVEPSQPSAPSAP
ncbi:hypothetical protein N9R54_04570, partial [Pelobium sp.]